MTIAINKKAKILVLDTAPLINQTSLYHLAERFVTTADVMSEVRDFHARNALSRLPVDIEVIHPVEKSMAAVAAFAKLTGDYASLSVTDLRVLALTWQLTSETGGSNSSIRTTPVLPHVKNSIKKPASSIVVSADPIPSLKNLKSDQSPTPSNIVQEAGKGSDANEGICAQFSDMQLVKRSHKNKSKKSRTCPTPSNIIQEAGKGSDATEGICAQFSDMQLVKRSHKNKPKKSRTYPPRGPPVEQLPQSNDNSEAPSLNNIGFNQLPGFVDIDSDNEEHDHKGWITPSNLDNAKHVTINGSRTVTDESIPSVACMSADFAIQNVLLQMGLNLLSLDGIRVKQLKNWLLRCHACFRTTTDLERRFCASCGGNTLTRVSYSIVDGQLKLHLKKNFQYKLRGTTYAVPKYQPGRNTNNIILCEDQREFQLKQKNFKHHMKKASKACFDDQLFGSGPIRPPSIGYGSRNPNQVVKMRK